MPISKLTSKVIAPKIVEVNPKSIELIKICSLVMNNGNKKNNDPASRGPNPAIEIGNEPSKKIPGTTKNIKKTFTSASTELRHIQKPNPNRT